MSAPEVRPGWVPARVPTRVDIFDTTLRDGSQKEGMSLTVDDKLKVAAQLDELGVTYIEGGWPGANPKDSEFFARARHELDLSTSTLVAFGMTRRPGVAAAADATLANLAEAGAPVACIVAKAWARHVEVALRTTPAEALAMTADSVGHLRERGLRVFVDAEHFFDGYRHDPGFATDVLATAIDAGAEAVVLCDTNGGTLPDEVFAVVGAVRPLVGVSLGVHFHNDGGCAVANSVVAVAAGADQVQGCINGYGERTGNADLCAVIANLSLKRGIETIPPDRLERLTPVSHHIAELVNIAPNPAQPYVGQSAFAHKAGLHTSALVRGRELYEHASPAAVGNASRVLVSELSGRSTVAMKAQELGLDLDAVAMAEVLQQLKDLEYRGYHFEAADGSLELLLRRAMGWEQSFFELESYRVITEAGRPPRAGFVAEATVKVVIPELDGKSRRVVATAEGNGPVNALDAALRQALEPRYPALAAVSLTDYKVRVLDSASGTAAVTRVLIDSADGDSTWSTIGVSGNIIEASWEALCDSIVYALLKGGGALVGAESDGPTNGARP